MWLTFLKEFKETTTFSSLNWQSDQCLHFYSDGSASHGCGIIFKTAWAFYEWPESWKKSSITDITVLELVPVVLGIKLWAEALQSQKLLLHIDSLALVHFLNNKTLKNEKVMSLVRYLVLICLQFNI